MCMWNIAVHWQAPVPALKVCNAEEVLKILNSIGISLAHRVGNLSWLGVLAYEYKCFAAWILSVVRR